ncbi:MAG: DUF4142 domain-containing protein [Caulobacteraceae bacterium]|nr:DUF4142 domain-containing protein [Caulobacter sp.]
MREQSTTYRLSKLSSPAFDSAMRASAIEEHRKDIAARERETKSGFSRTAAFARSAIPTLRKHLVAAEALPK